MQDQGIGININNSTLNKFTTELGADCENVTALVNQLQLANLSNKQKVDILFEFLSATIHIHSHCGNDF